jgi:hypothetical protein
MNSDSLEDFYEISRTPSKKGFLLFLISTAFMVIAFAAAIALNTLNVDFDYEVLLTIPTLISFGLSIAGIIFSVIELSTQSKIKSIIALIGHLLIIGLFVYIIFLAFTGSV